MCVEMLCFTLALFFSQAQLIKSSVNLEIFQKREAIQALQTRKKIQKQEIYKKKKAFIIVAFNIFPFHDWIMIMTFFYIYIYTYFLVLIFPWLEYQERQFSW